ncbi:MAG TPA: hypothetical protein DCR17_00305 [Verrucomicrobiales bacterium]|nr:hypothetical protein [Pedosphaera sp.]RZO67894.1 MAG: hypothetical protein EVA71_10435 [Limisphaerales bacterium]HAO65114.1 hypothetical protein [Verrucomicrobiales bacterium]HAR00411.1 hypothetical protein [Verrucomicrobiales bacterium]HAW01189.1 hypothetical protein [Verrucomicrobiales bacterium]
MEACKSPTQLRRVINACLAGSSAPLGVDMVASWGSYFLRDKDGGAASSSEFTMTYGVMFGLSLILSIVLARWQWRRSSQSTQMYEVLATGTWMLICFLLSARPTI